MGSEGHSRERVPKCEQWEHCLKVKLSQVVTCKTTYLICMHRVTKHQTWKQLDGRAGMRVTGSSTESGPQVLHCPHSSSSPASRLSSSSLGCSLLPHGFVKSINHVILYAYLWNGVLNSDNSNRKRKPLCRLMLG